MRTGVAFHLREQLESKELCIGRGDEPTVRLWVGVSWQTNISDVVVGACFRRPDQEEVVDK